MSVINVIEAQTTGEAQTQIDKQSGILSYACHRIFHVECDSTADDDSIVLGNIQIPQDAEQHPTRIGLYVYQRQAKRMGNRFWDVDCEYDNQPSQQTKNPSPKQQPTQNDPKVSWTYETKKKPAPVQWQTISHDVKNPYTGQVQAGTPTFTAKGAVNSAGEPYTDPPVMKEVELAVLNVERYETISSPDLYFNYVGAINSDVFYGAAPGNVRCWITATREKVDGVFYMNTKYKFLFDEDGHNPTVLDCGTFYLDGSGNQTAFKDKDGNQLPKGLLDGNGGKLPAGQNPVFKTFQMLPQTAFSVLNIPNYFQQQ